VRGRGTGRPTPGEQDPDYLGDEEGQLLAYWIDRLTGTGVEPSSAEQALERVLKVTEIGEEIPLHVALTSRVRAPQGEELAWAREAAGRLRLP
jgi:hypothetical protein